MCFEVILKKMVEASYVNDPEQLNLAKYYGTVKPVNTSMINTNKQIVMALSQPISQFTASFFNDTLQGNMDEAQFELIQQV